MRGAIGADSGDVSRAERQAEVVGGSYRELSALTPLQVQILVALHQDRSEHAICQVYEAPGERVTVGDLEFAGETAIRSVSLLQGSGYVKKTDHDGFDLTMSGKHLAELAVSSLGRGR